MSTRPLLASQMLTPSQLAGLYKDLVQGGHCLLGTCQLMV